MTKHPCFPAGLIAGSVLLSALAGCVTAGSGPARSHPANPAVAARASLMIEDDYDYYPRYEIYYSRRRNEYVYRDATAWVRRTDLRGITLAMLNSGPVVRMDFHDSPEFHHASIVQRFPRNWAQPGQKHDNKNNHHDEQKGDTKESDKKSGQ